MTHIYLSIEPSGSKIFIRANHVMSARNLFATFTLGKVIEVYFISHSFMFEICGFFGFFCTFGGFFCSLILQNNPTMKFIRIITLISSFWFWILCIPVILPSVASLTYLSLWQTCLILLFPRSFFLLLKCFEQGGGMNLLR